MILSPFQSNKKQLQAKKTCKSNHCKEQFTSNKLCLANPFLRENLVPNQKAKSINSSPVSLRSYICLNERPHSTSKLNSHEQYSTRKYQSAIKRSFNSITFSEELSGRFIRNREFEIERKRINLFGPDIIKYTPNTVQKNIEYFKTKKQEQFLNNKNPKRNVFEQSSNIYQNSRKDQAQHKQNESPKNLQQTHKMMSSVEINELSKDKKPKTKKMLSWNVQLQQQKSKNNGARRSQKQYNSLKAQNQERFVNMNDDYEISPTFGYINAKQNYSQSQTNSRNSYDQARSKFSKCPSIRMLNQKQKMEKDYVMELSDGFKMQNSSPSSSLSSMFQIKNMNRNNPYASGSVFERGNYNNLAYNSNFEQSSTDQKDRYRKKVFERALSKGSQNKKTSFGSHNANWNSQNYRNSSESPPYIKYEGQRFQLILL